MSSLIAAQQQGKDRAPELRDRRERASIALPTRIVARLKSSLVFLEPAEIWAFEAADRMTYVHSRHGRFEIDVSLAMIEASMDRRFTRVHRNWLISISHVKQLERGTGETTLFVGARIEDESQGVRVPVSRNYTQAVREMLLTNAIGVRR